MKILLIDPPFYQLLGLYNRYFPYPLVTLGSFLKKNGYKDVLVYDADRNIKANSLSYDYSKMDERYDKYLNSFDENKPVWAELKEFIIKYKPDLVGISIWTTFAASSFFTAQIVKNIDSQIKVVLGGPHANVKANEILSISTDVDFVIRGEGENTLLSILNNIKRKEEDFSSIDGLSYRIGSKISHNPREDFSVDINSTAYPDRSLLLYENTYSPEDMGLIMTSRGCPFSCKFCATITKHVRHRKIENIIAEIKYVKRQYGTIQFTFKDDSFTVNKKRIMEFCNVLINEKVKICWECNTRVNLINIDLLKLMKKAGCNFIKIGIESGNNEILKRMNKGITVEEVIEKVALIKKVKIHWTGYFLIGIPGETESNINETIDFLYKINPDFTCLGVFEPFPGTPLFDEGVNKKIFKNDMTYKEFFSTSPANYYRLAPYSQSDVIPNKTFKRIKDEIQNNIYKYNRSFSRILKMFLARLHIYFRKPSEVFLDFFKFLKY